ncbi:hypothetical protein DL770_010113 [Monosporascus sp. CRB-9-2]|nr:hypothetical protein DL770_010113 [Monosporascus sp. CRB-9-2]
MPPPLSPPTPRPLRVHIIAREPQEPSVHNNPLHATLLLLPLSRQLCSLFLSPNQFLSTASLSWPRCPWAAEIRKASLEKVHTTAEKETGGGEPSSGASAPLVDLSACCGPGHHHSAPDVDGSRAAEKVGL